MQPNPGRPTSASLPPRRSAIRQRIWTTLGVPVFAAMLVAMVMFTSPALLSDWQIRGSAQPARQAEIVKGACTKKLVVAICDVTLAVGIVGSAELRPRP